MFYRARRAAVVGVMITGACASGNQRPGALTTVDVPPIDAPALPIEDAGTVPVDASDNMDAPVAVDALAPYDVTFNEAGYPLGPYGYTVSSVFEPFQLPTCVGANYAFDGPDFSAARFTVVNLVALWCTACATDAHNFESNVYIPYHGRGVRVIEVLTEGAAAQTATSADCVGWSGRYGLTFPVLMDPLGAVQRAYATDHVYPAIYIVDSRGRVRWNSFGSTRGAADVAVALDNLLAGP